MSEKERVPNSEIQDESTKDLADMQAVFDEEEVLDDTPRSIFKDIAKQIISGADLTRISMPAFISEPHSFIETTANLFSHISFFREALAATDPVDRLALLTRFYISGFHIRPRGVKKPYNPILGEVFKCFWDHEDGTRTWYVAEQVSHHPPISAFYFENLESGYTIEGQIQIKANFTGNSAGTFMVGTIFVHLLRHRETYTITYPVWYARGVVVGVMRMETCGKTHIQCKQTGLEAVIDFKAKPKFHGKYNQIEADIYRMDEGAHPMGPISQTIQPPPEVTPSSSSSRSSGKGWLGFGGDKDPYKHKKPLIHIWGDWTDSLFATDLRPNPTLTTPYTPAMLKQAAEIQWKLTHNLTPFDPATAGSEKLPVLTPVPIPPTSPANTVVFFDVRCSPFISKRALALSHQQPFESRVVWQKLTEMMNKQDYEQARLAKVAVEERQREILKERTKKRQGFRQRYFHFDPFPRTEEEAEAYPTGRYRLNFSVDCTSSAPEIDPSKRLFTCFNLPDMHELMVTWPMLTEELIKKDEDAKTTDYLSIQKAAEAIRKQKSAASSSSSSSRIPVVAPPSAEEEKPVDFEALMNEGVFGPKWPMDVAQKKTEADPAPASSSAEAQ